jgi:hypothetical protein
MKLTAGTSKFLVLTAVKMLMLVFNLEDGCSMFLRYVDINLQVRTAIQPRKTMLSSSRNFLERPATSSLVQIYSSALCSQTP